MKLRQLITSTNPKVRNSSLESACTPLSYTQLLEECADLELFRRNSDNLYDRVRALFFLYAIHRFLLPARKEIKPDGRIPFAGYDKLLSRRFEEAIHAFQELQKSDGLSDGLSSALGAGYYALAFQTLAGQVRKSVRSVPGNRWMFRMGHPADHCLRIRPELLERPSASSPYPILRERTPVRMDLTHSCWSDIFFLGMDYPEGAKVLNVSIDLGVHGRDAEPKPPIEVYLRVIDEPVLRLVSVDLDSSADITELSEVFNFAKDYTGLLKAGVISSGIVPPGLEGSEQKLTDLLAHLVGPGRGLEIVSQVNNIPKGSRLAVSTNLLAGVIAVCMRATRQARSLTGPLEESERRLVAARAILGEWIGGSGGGWQDSGGVWPGIKKIEGTFAVEGDPEFGISRGRLLPQHTVMGERTVPQLTRQQLQDSLVLVHGGMAQNVGPILEMVTEKYLLRGEKEWTARQNALGLFDHIVDSLRQGRIQDLAKATTKNFREPIQQIIPWASNYFTETLISRIEGRLKSQFWGFWMLGGMSGGGMGFIVDPSRKVDAQAILQEEMSKLRRELVHSLPFAMDPVVYDFRINPNGTHAELLEGAQALLSPGYYALCAPLWLKQDIRRMSPLRRDELTRMGAACRSETAMAGVIETLFERLLPKEEKKSIDSNKLEDLLTKFGFDREQHERIRTDLRRGLIGLAQNRLSSTSSIEDVSPRDIIDTRGSLSEHRQKLGRQALERGEVLTVTLAAGAGSRWTQGAGVVKALHPFCKLASRHRTFLEVHLAKARKSAKLFGPAAPVVFTTGYMTHAPIQQYLQQVGNYNYSGEVMLSTGRSVGLRMVPMVRDLRFAWEEVAHQQLDEQKQKMRESIQAALINWARSVGEANDYTDNLPMQCLHPVGHWFEIPNMLRNGVLRDALRKSSQLKYLLIHNIDTLGANLDAGLLGTHIETGKTLSYEVISKRIDDRGGGLARIDGRTRIVEGLALPRQEDEFKLLYYNTLTTWATIDQLLEVFGLHRSDLENETKVAEAVHRLAGRMPTYITLKDVKKRWGHGQEDIFPVCQFEKLWGDMTALTDLDCGFLVVPRMRGQQLKDQAQLDGWLREGSADYIERICDWT
ncbi:UTP--glucose-1-phosphate uridylyltransferase [Telmatocola sphagniphila]|uniref:UTP--glucose-1-phosphate uridylyltransferase n=1 Tax=Telmatocola sphagniphila TaxID=1123043 RepID=A0A8E6B5K9_9BACT|nr:UTP--glucose-1-phosphate uridylyltransferase [Telmatocola sphagniphila]QVL31889.1 UTP--glucose-1-phosphate uridylyltransferase [Telmatocola sphagniphila]